MLIWQGNLQAQWPLHDSIQLKIQLWCDNCKLNLADLALEFAAFVRPNAVPLQSIKGPVFNVYSDEPTTIEYFGQLTSSKLGILATASTSERAFDHLLFYSSDDQQPRIYVRPLSLDPRPESEPGLNGSKPAAACQEQLKLDVRPKMLQQVILGALRMRGYNSRNDDYRQIYKLCYKTTELIIEKQPQRDITLELIKEKVDLFLNLLE